MIEKFNKIIDKISGFKNFYILRRERKAVIISCRPLIHQVIKFPSNPFNRNFEKRADKKIGIFFLITFLGKGANNALKKEFEEKQLPILYLEDSHIKSSVEELQNCLNDFVFKFLDS